MKILISLLLSLFAVSGIYSQSYDGTIILKNGKRIDADAISIEDDIITFNADNSSYRESINKSEVRMLRAYDGNYAAEGLGLGAALGCALYLNAMTDYDRFDATILSYTLGIGAIVGLAIGALSSNKKSIRITENSNVSILDSQSYSPLTNELNITLINYKLNF